ncbi:MAG: protein kinase [Deltaproteobacteria bacterium]|nr:protein kinase [Deltaproteobacteria bacterium]
MTPPVEGMKERGSAFGEGRAGLELPGGYELLKRIGVGGMAEVFLARQTVGAGVERPVVIKRMLPEIAGDPLFVSMFVEEARVAAQLQHPNIVQIYDVVMAGTCPCIVMEHLDGFDVRWLARRSGERASRTVPVAAVAAIGAGAAHGLGHAHRKRGLDGRPLGIVHRDVSPHNLFVTRDGAVKVVDFGIAKSSAQMTATQEGAIKGKIPYMSPEQVRGEALDASSDLFSLGVVLWETATGHRLFRRGSVEQAVQAVLASPIPAPSQVLEGLPPRFDEITCKALARDRAARYATAKDLAQDLEELAQELKAGSSQILLSRLIEKLVRAGEEKMRLPPSKIDTEEVTNPAGTPPRTGGERDARDSQVAGRSAILTVRGGVDGRVRPGRASELKSAGPVAGETSIRAAVPTKYGGFEAPMAPPAGSGPSPGAARPASPSGPEPDLEAVDAALEHGLSSLEAPSEPELDSGAPPSARARPASGGRELDAAEVPGAPLDLAVDVARERKAQVFREDLDRKARSLADYGEAPGLLRAPLYALRVRRRRAWLARRVAVLREAVEAARAEALQLLSGLGEKVRTGCSSHRELGSLLDQIERAEGEMRLRAKEVEAGDASVEERRLLEAARAALRALLADLGRRALEKGIVDPDERAATTARAAKERAATRGRDLELYERARMMFDQTAVRRGWVVLSWSAVIVVAAAVGACYLFGLL